MDLLLNSSEPGPEREKSLVRNDFLLTEFADYASKRFALFDSNFRRQWCSMGTGIRDICDQKTGKQNY